MVIDHGRRIESRPRGLITAEQRCNRVLLVAGVGAGVTGNVNERTEGLGVHHRQVECAGAAHRPSGHSPLAPVVTYPKVRGHVRHHIFDEMVGGVTTTTVHALGVVVERPGGIREHQHRRVSTVPGGEVVGGLRGVARPYPVRGSIQRRPDH
ncbi:Uncharacterised protein [Mycobacteroides abscessus subsp. massiliense]|nr:Uncharacterised protein [Mycobacteroides abscessus subsp. massiliense]